jgi:hypothetical protein
VEPLLPLHRALNDLSASTRLMIVSAFFNAFVFPGVVLFARYFQGIWASAKVSDFFGREFLVEDAMGYGIYFIIMMVI